MDHKQIVKQMIELNRTAFENAFNTMTILHDQAERMGEMLMDQAAWMPREGKKVSDEWIKACKQGRETFKRAMVDGFNKTEAFFTEV